YVPVGIGVCEIESNSAMCWDMQGHLDGVLLSRVTQGLTAQSGITLPFGKKSFFAVIENGDRTYGYHVQGSKERTSRTWYPAGYGRQFVLVQLDVPRSQQGAVVEQLPYETTFGEPPPAKQSGPVEILTDIGVQLRSLSSVRWDPDQEYEGYSLRNFLGNKTSVLELSRPPHDDLTPCDLAIQAYDHKGRPISFVDSKGNPATLMDFAAGVAANESGPPRGSYFYWVDYFTGNQSEYPFKTAKFEPLVDSSEGTFRFESNISPAAIGSIKVVNLFRGIPIGRFPLSFKELQTSQLPIKYQQGNQE
ncbi:MAG TPA: hypothetical protein VG944_21670, partial [Fimbriimonas sp.]|nr:hypothetical protein [Fimbriimonas sp.]